MAEILKLEPLTKSAFTAYGDVIETKDSNSFDINDGTTTRFHDLAQVQLLGENPRPLISIARCQEFQLPIEVNMMERHPLGSQAFIPMNNQSYLVVVAEDNNGTPQNPCAFLVNGNQGVNYHANVWHFTLVAFDKVSDFLIVDRGGEGNNLEEFFFDNSYLVK
ncbi:MAG: ureidoglycolate lyase [Rhizobiaceae bacterium]|nr:ureidoglycolate lyase [Rhizobiaceae bacterium]